MAVATASPRLMGPWWLGLIVSIALIIVGLLLLSAPAATTVVIVQVLGLWWLVGGIVELESGGCPHEIEPEPLTPTERVLAEQFGY